MAITNEMKATCNAEQRNYDISIIIPFYNEQGSLKNLYHEIIAALKDGGKTFEIIFVDDGSTDGSAEVVETIAAGDSRAKFVQLARNFGQTAAMAAGFAHANGRIYVPLDADGQNDPADIPKLIAKIDEGFDVASGWRRDRKDKFITRRVPSVIANKLLSRVTGLSLKDYGCSLKAYRANYIDSITLYGEMHRFIPAYAFMSGAKVVEVPVNHRPRLKGSSKYGLGRIFKVAIDLVTVKFLSNYATKPGYLFGGIGSLLCLLGVAAAAEVIVEKLSINTYAHKNPFLLLAVFLFFLGVQFFLMGLIAELLVRTYHESQGKPTYMVRKFINFGHETQGARHETKGF